MQLQEHLLSQSLCIAPRETSLNSFENTKSNHILIHIFVSAQWSPNARMAFKTLDHLLQLNISVYLWVVPPSPFSLYTCSNLPTHLIKLNNGYFCTLLYDFLCFRLWALCPHTVPICVTKAAPACGLIVYIQHTRPFLCISGSRSGEIMWVLLTEYQASWW